MVTEHLFGKIIHKILQAYHKGDMYNTLVREDHSQGAQPIPPAVPDGLMNPTLNVEEPNSFYVKNNLVVIL